jgi:hypothetical protein
MPENASALIIDRHRIRLSAGQTPSGMPITQLISTAGSETADERMTIGRISWRTDSINLQYHRTVTFVVAIRRHDNHDSNLFSRTSPHMRPRRLAQECNIRRIDAKFFTEDLFRIRRPYDSVRSTTILTRNLFGCDNDQWERFWPFLLTFEPIDFLSPARRFSIRSTQGIPAAD